MPQRGCGGRTEQADEVVTLRRAIQLTCVGEGRQSGHPSLPVLRSREALHTGSLLTAPASLPPAFRSAPPLPCLVPLTSWDPGRRAC